MKPCTIHSEGPILSSKSSRCFTIDVSLRPKYHKASAFLDSRASPCFLDEEFLKRHNISLVKKTKFVHVEIIDGYLLSSRDVTCEILLIEVAINGHSSFVIFNIIRSLSNLVILSLSWVKKYNPHID